MNNQLNIIKALKAKGVPTGIKKEKNLKTMY